MKNFEKYINLILENKYGLPNACYVYKELMNNENCQGLRCGKTCFIRILKWLNQDYVEPIKLSHDEYVILKNVPKKYKWIWRDLNEELYISENAPIIDENNNYLGLGCFADLPYNYDFLFVNCEDEPYEIAKLIADYESNNQPNKTDVVREVYSSEVETVRKCGDFFPLRNREKEHEDVSK